MKGPISRISAYARWIIMFLLVAFALPALAQQSKGERAVDNQRQIRQTKSKTVKRKDKSKTRDLAGRRLRTRNKSSANSANVGIRQPNPYAGRPRVTTDRAAKSKTRTYSESPSERPRTPKGDIAGHRIRTPKPRPTEAARRNVYTQSGPYMNNPDRKPRDDRRPRVSQTTASGQPIIRRMPQPKERAWTGDLKGKPVKPPRSVTSQRENTFPQPTQYPTYEPSKGARDRAVSNQRELRQTSKLTRPPRTKSVGGGGYPDTPKKGFVQRGRKNVYWGKFSKGEKAITRDLAGAPLRTRNYRSPTPGLVGRDTLEHFGRKPGGDFTYDSRRKEKLSPRAHREWRGDISGSRLRRITPSNIQHEGKAVFPRSLMATKRGDQASKSLTGAPLTTGRKGETVGTRLRGKAPGIGASTMARDMARTKGSLTKGFMPQGEDFTGFIKVRGKKGIPASARKVGSFSGNMLGGQGKTFRDQGEGFSGYLKARKPLKGGGSVSGQLWNNGNAPTTRNTLPSSASKPIGFAGHLLSGQGKTFEDQGESFSGYLKAKKPLKGGGSVSGRLWNNRNAPITQNTLPRSASKPISFAGNMLGSGKQFTSQGEDFTGYMKAKKPAKGAGGSVSGQLWNNRNAPITQNTLPRSASKPISFAGDMLGSGKQFRSQGEDFTGYMKAKKPAKGAGGSVSGQLWNNNGQPITRLDRDGLSTAEANFQGREKASARKMNTDGFDSKGNITMKQSFTQSPNAVAESSKKHEPNRAGFRIEGLKVRVEQPDYSDRVYTADGALRGIGPKRATVRAAEFSSGAVMPERRHNPFAADEAMRGTYYGGGSAGKVSTFHGNLRVKKFSGDRKLHPDAKFAHGKDNNVKEERTVLTNVKLFWTKLFHKSESQPTSVREKERRPRYDKREIGMWAD